MPDAGIVAISYSPPVIHTASAIHETVQGIQIIDGLYGFGGLILLGIIAWLIIYTWKVWPSKAMAKAALDHAAALAKVDAAKNNKPQMMVDKTLNDNYQGLDKRINDLSARFEQSLLACGTCQREVRDSVHIIESGIDTLNGEFIAFKTNITDSVRNLDDRVWDILKLKNSNNRSNRNSNDGAVNG